MDFSKTETTQIHESIKIEDTNFVHIERDILNQNILIETSKDNLHEKETNLYNVNLVKIEPEQPEAFFFRTKEIFMNEYVEGKVKFGIIKFLLSMKLVKILSLRLMEIDPLFLKSKKNYLSKIENLWYKIFSIILQVSPLS
ncbi:hypothetical protein HHI36_021689 [Cryptolaemus montrouzieri]|uniref:Uncharacterized protein n=1 Tax=Cryptolaemus montrouzieri TaxID=559131 RepID=A0ABD2MXL5_9CUCU